MKSFKQIKEDWQLQKRLLGIHPAIATTITTAFSVTGGVLSFAGVMRAANLFTDFSQISELAVIFQGGLSMIDMTLGLGLAGMGAMGARDLVDCLKGNPRIREEITRENAAGQTVKGPMWAVSFLQDAQREINDLTKTFNPVAVTQEQQDKLQAVIDAARPLQKEVTIVSAGNKGAGTEMYEFLFKAQIHEIRTIQITKTLKDSACIVNDRPDDKAIVKLPLGVIRKGR